MNSIREKNAAPKYQISVVMPALDEEKNLELAVRETQSAFAQLGIQGEIVLINDGSRDGTGPLAEKLKDEFGNMQVIHHPTSRGIGSSFWEGMQIAAGSVVTMLPGDGENDPREILRYFPLMSEVDMIIPYVYNTAARGMSRRWLSKLYKAVINFSFGMLLNYMNGTVMYRKVVLQSISLRSTGFFYQTELLIKGIRCGYLYAEVPYALGQRSTGKSKAISLRSLLKVSKDYLVTVYSVYFETTGPKSEFPPESATGQRRLPR